MYNSGMGIINFQSFKFFAQLLREKYPEAVLGFLGNSVAAAGLMDRFMMNENDVTLEQYLIPFSGKCICSMGAGMPQTDYIYKAENMTPRMETYIEYINQSAIAPETIIEENKTLVMVDRVLNAEGLVSFGYLWNKAAQDKGYSSEDIKGRMLLSPLAPLWKEGSYLSYTVCGATKENILYQGNFDLMVHDDSFSRVINDVTTLDHEPWHTRLVPQHYIDRKNSEDSDTQLQSAYNAIHALYNMFEDHEAEIVNPPSSGRFFLPGPDAPVNPKTAGIILA